MSRVLSYLLRRSIQIIQSCKSSHGVCMVHGTYNRHIWTIFEPQFLKYHKQYKEKGSIDVWRISFIIFLERFLFFYTKNFLGISHRS